MRPSDLLEMREQGIPDFIRFDLDAAVVDFMEDVRARMNEEVIGPDPRKKKPGKGETWVPKYATVDALLDLYEEAYAAGDDPDLSEPLPSADEIAAAMAEMEADQPVLD